MKDISVVMAWIVAACAVIAIPVINLALLTASMSVFFGMLVGFTASTLLERFTIFEGELGWIIGFCTAVFTSFYVWNVLLINFR